MAKKIKKDRIVTIQLSVESFDKHGDTEKPNTVHSSSRVVSAACSEKQAAELSATLLAALGVAQPDEDDSE